jgi:hypothetical protein
MVKEKRMKMGDVSVSRRVRGKTPETLRKVRIVSTLALTRPLLQTALSMAGTTCTPLDLVDLQETSQLTFHQN